MGQPIWQIRAQNLGTIAENIFFEYELEAIDTDTQPVTYSLIAGTLPVGIQLTGTAISGIPIKITGIPADVDVDTTTQFSIRATTTTNEVSDITLDLTVSGQTAPEILTAAGQLGTFFYGDYVDLQLDALDLDSGNILIWSVINNTLPDGLELIVDSDNDRIAYIRGYPTPATALPPGIIPGFDAQNFDEDLGEFGFDFGLNTIDKSFEFIISVTDGIGFDSSTYSIFLQSTLLFTADSDTITADSDTITSDISNKISPILSTVTQDLGTVLHDNYFTFQFVGLDFEGDSIEFAIDSGAVPASLVVDPVTGWLYGNIDVITTTTETFTFAITVNKVADPEFVSDPVTFTMTVVSDLAGSLVINSPLVMTIENGAISELVIDAAASSSTDFSVNADFDGITVDQLLPTADLDTNIGMLSISIQYALVEGTGQLPIGLALTQDGLIVGRPSFTHFTLDAGTTTFDENTTTFDTTYTFTVRIVDVTLGVIDQLQTFSIIVTPTNVVPYENLYLKSGPTLEERALYETIIADDAIIPRANVYRNSDLYFGVQPDLRFLLADGLAPATRPMYAIILEDNHYTRRFSFSQLKIAKAVDTDGAALYEVIYADIVDSLVNDGNSVGAELVVDGVDLTDLTNRVPPAVPQFDELGNIIIRPASLVNMRNTIIGTSTGNDALLADNDILTSDDTFTVDDTDIVPGQLNLNTLPKWMTTTQDDGRVFGFIPAVPLVYCNPGEASQILFDINQSGFNINEISFDVDRYVWDNNLTNVVLEYFFTLGDTEASFDDIDPNGSFVGGVDYFVGQEIVMSNGAVLLVDAIDAFGAVTEFTITTIGTEIQSNVLLELNTVIPTLVPYAALGHVGDGDFEGDLFAFEVTTAGDFWIGHGMVFDDSTFNVFDQSGTEISGFTDNEANDGMEVEVYTLATGIYQLIAEQYDGSEGGGPSGIIVAPEDGIGLDGGTVGTPTAVHSGLRYIGKITNDEPTTSVAALGSLPALLTDLQNRHCAVGYIDGTTDDGHLFQFEVGTAGSLSFIVGTGWPDGIAPGGPDIGFSIYDSAGALVTARDNASDGQTLEYRYTFAMVTGVFQLHVYNTQPFLIDADTPGSPFGVWIMSDSEEMRLDDNGFETGDLSATGGLVYDRQLNGDLTPGPIGSGFTIIPIRPADAPDVDDELLKFPKTDVFQ